LSHEKGGARSKRAYILDDTDGCGLGLGLSQGKGGTRSKRLHVKWMDVALIWG
jgi:hypothetical protein